MKSFRVILLAAGLGFALCTSAQAAHMPPPANGACGSTANTCTAGSAYGYDAAAGTWTCQGSGGGTDASCSVPSGGQ